MLISEGTTIFAVALDRVDWSDEFPFPATGRYVRAQIVDQYGNVLALSNALWRATL
jgi:hypothetical protein